MTKKLTVLLLTYFTFIVKAEDPVLVILGGNDDHNTLNTSLVVGLQNDYECTIGDLYYRTFGAIGGVIGSQMVYCGGFVRYHVTIGDCFYYDPDSNLWVDRGHEYDMKDSRYFGGYASTEHGLLVTGGSLCSRNFQNAKLRLDFVDI